MSGRFDSGVSGYIVGKCEVKVFFPVDLKGEPDISCKQCQFYRVSSRSCALNDKIVPWGEKFVAPTCPLRREEMIDESERENEEKEKETWQFQF